MSTIKITGIWISESGMQDGRDTLVIESANGVMYDPCVGPEIPIRCEQYRDESPIMTNGAWQFWPDKHSLARHGIAPKAV